MSLSVVVGDSLAKSFGLWQVYDVVDDTTYIPDDVLMQDLWAATHCLYLGRGGGCGVAQPYEETREQVAARIRNCATVYTDLRLEGYRLIA